MEFVLDFVLPPRKRIDLINRLFAGNSQLTAADAINSNFLSAVTLKVTITADGFNEDLSTPNVAGARPFTLFSLKGTPDTLEAACGQMEALCKRCGGELPSELVALETKPETVPPYRLRLGLPDLPGPFPISAELAGAVHHQFATMESIDPLRRMPASSPILGKHVLTADVSNLPDVLHWLYNNKPKQFRKIEAEVSKLVPNLGKLYTPTQQNQATLGIIDDIDEDLVYSMNQMSFGTRSVVAVIAKVILAAPGAWICIEEPETYLHPKAQMELFQFLRDEAKTKRIFVATHSTSIAASCPLSSLFIVRRDAENSTIVTPVTPADAFEVIEQLGVKPSFSFEAGAIVFVESGEHVPIFEAWAKKFDFRVKVQFLDAEGACTLHYLANARDRLERLCANNDLRGLRQRKRYFKSIKKTNHRTTGIAAGTGHHHGLSRTGRLLAGSQSHSARLSRRHASARGTGSAAESRAHVDRSEKGAERTSAAFSGRRIQQPSGGADCGSNGGNPGLHPPTLRSNRSQLQAVLENLIRYFPRSA